VANDLAKYLAMWQKSGKNLTPPIYLYFIGEQLGY